MITLNLSRHLSKNLTVAVTGSLLLTAPLIMHASEALDQLLDGERQHLRQSSPYTFSLWTNLVVASEGIDTNRIYELAVNFRDINDATEPYQKDFAERVVQVLDLTRGTWLPAGYDDMRSRQKQMQSTTEDLQRKFENLNAKKVAAEEDVKKKQDALEAAAKGSLWSRIAPWEQFHRAADTTRANMEMNLDSAKSRLNDVLQQLSEVNSQLDSSYKSTPDVDKWMSDEVDKHAAVVRRNVVASIHQLNEERYARVALALGNIYVRFIGNDAEVTGLTRRADELCKKEDKAQNIAAEIAKEANEFILQARPWDAKKALDEAKAKIDDRVHEDKELRVLVGREVGAVQRRAEQLTDAAMKQRNSIFALSRTDPKILDKLQQFILDHPDYPDAETDRSSLALQVYGDEIKTIEMMIAKKPLLAFQRLQKLGDRITEQHADVLKAQIAALLDQALSDAIAGLRGQLKEALDLRLKAETLHERRAKELVISEATGIEETVASEADAWLKQPMDEVFKAKFNSIAKQARPQKEDPKRKDFLPIIMKALGIAVLLFSGWFAFMSKRNPKWPSRFAHEKH